MSNENKEKKKLVKGRHASAIKRARQAEKRKARNTARKSRVSTFEKKVMTALQKRDAKSAQAALSSFMSEIDKAAQRGVVHFKRAARRISSLSKQVAQLSSK